MRDEDFYAFVVKEIENNIYDEALWIKVKVKSDFNEKAARRKYIEERVKQLKSHYLKGLISGAAMMGKKIVSGGIGLVDFAI